MKDGIDYPDQDGNSVNYLMPEVMTFMKIRGIRFDGKPTDAQRCRDLEDIIMNNIRLFLRERGWNAPHGLDEMIDYISKNNITMKEMSEKELVEWQESERKKKKPTHWSELQ